MLVDAVGRPSLGKATAILTGGINIARAVSPAVVGLLVDAHGFVSGYVFLISLHLVSLMCTFRLRKHPAGMARREGFIRELAGGYTYIFHNRSLGMAILFGILPMLVVAPLQNLMVVLVDEMWGAGSSGLGMMMGAMGIGGLIGSLVMTLTREGSLVKPMVGGTFFMAGFLLLFSHAPFFWLALAMAMGVSGCSVFSQTTVQTAVQLMAEDHIRGRITTITLMSFSLSPIGTIPLAYAVKHLGGQWGLSIAAVLLTVGVLLMWRFSSAFRGIDEASKV